MANNNKEGIPNDIDQRMGGIDVSGLTEGLNIFSRRLIIGAVLVALGAAAGVYFLEN